MTKENNQPVLSYKSAGVDIDAGNRLVDRIKPVAKQTFRPEVMAGLGGFGALFELPIDRYKQPVLVSGTDGVGTKLKLAIEMNQYQTIGIDLVAMCANDLIVQGAEPLYFLDYYATGKLDVDVAESVIKGIAKGCQLAGAALIGGETAEMPGIYASGDFDLAGFCVGIVEKEHIIDGSQVKAGDQLVGIASSGPHSNGYSLIRKIIETSQADLQQSFEDSTLGETLLSPTTIYVPTVLNLIAKTTINAISHITGGGLLENLPRVIPTPLQVQLDRSSWQQPAIFGWLQETGHLSDEEMLRTFNCGIGLVLCVPAEGLETVLNELRQANQKASVIGEVSTRADDEAAIIIR